MGVLDSIKRSFGSWDRRAMLIAGGGTAVYYVVTVFWFPAVFERLGLIIPFFTLYLAAHYLIPEDRTPPR